MDQSKEEIRQEKKNLRFRDVHEYLAKKMRDNLKISVRNGTVAERIFRHGQAIDVVQDMWLRISKTAETYSATGRPQVAGRIAEEWHAGTFNKDAALKGRRDLHARTTASNGQHSAVFDIEVLQYDAIVTKAQSKYNNSTARTAFELSNKKYDGMQKLHPSDQNVGNLASKRGTSGIDQRNYPDTAKNATDKLHYENVESDPLSYNEANYLADDATVAAKKVVQQEMLNAIKGGAIIGATTSGSISVVVNTRQVLAGEKKSTDAAKDVVVDTAVGGIDGATKGATTIVIKSGLNRVGARVIARSSVPIAMAMAVVDTGKDIRLAVTGKIGPKELIVRTGKHVVNNAGAWAGMEGGAAIGTFVFPGVGTIAGGLIGGMAGYIGVSMISEHVLMMDQGATTGFWLNRLNTRLTLRGVVQDEELFPCIRERFLTPFGMTGLQQYFAVHRAT